MFLGTQRYVGPSSGVHTQPRDIITTLLVHGVFSYVSNISLATEHEASLIIFSSNNRKQGPQEIKGPDLGRLVNDEVRTRTLFSCLFDEMRLSSRTAWLSSPLSSPLF